MVWSFAVNPRNNVYGLLKSDESFRNALHRYRTRPDDSTRARVIGLHGFRLTVVSYSKICFSVYFISISHVGNPGVRDRNATSRKDTV
jgi:hypothetical protein